MRTHERVLAQIEADLRAGKWGLGERLPGERALAEQLGVSRPSVREAIRILEAMGILRTAVGSGPGSGATVIDRPAAGLGAAVRLHVASGTLPVSDVVATRALLESWTAREAAARAVAAGASAPGAADDAPELLSGARHQLDLMCGTELSVAEFIERDQDFHLEIARAAGNQLVEAIMTGMRSAVGSYVTAGAERLPAWESTALRLCGEHRTIIEAIGSGDADGADKAMRAHIEGFYRETGLGGD